MKSLQTHLDYCPSTDYIKTMSDYSAKVDADLILLPWVVPAEMNNFLENTNMFDLEFAHQAFSTMHHCTTGIFIDRGFGQIQDGDNELIPQIIIIYREECRDDQAALLFALRLQAYRKIDLMVLRKGPQQSTLSYANNQTIQEYTLGHDIDKLFVLDDSAECSSNSSNVVCKQVETLNDITHSLTSRPLDKHDLVVFGKNSSDQDILSEEHQAYENALGSFGYQFLKSDTNKTSVLIIQSHLI
jgi:hypothetical protein